MHPYLPPRKKDITPVGRILSEPPPGSKPKGLYVHVFYERGQSARVHIEAKASASLSCGKNDSQ